MERLTHEADLGFEDWEETLFFVKSDPDGAYDILDIAKYQGDPEFDEILKNISLRLAAYENTDLEPEEISTLCDMDRRAKMAEMLHLEESFGVSIDRLRELAQADRDGRCVVLPCKGWFDLVFGEQEVFYGIDADYPENPIREITVRNEERFTWYDGWESVTFNGTYENGLDHEFTPEEIGKTVFLTREEAEAKLKEREKNG